jgi:Family of unknown function (DUF5709)
MADDDENPDVPSADAAELEDDGVLDAADTLEGSPGEDPLDQGIVAPDRWTAAERYGTTLEEERAGESLDQLLAEEEPDVDPYAEAAGDRAAPSEGTEGDSADEDVDGLLLDDGADPRSGRLVADDEGSHEDDEPELVARDVGIDAGAASAEEAAVHVVDDDDADVRSDG